MAASRAAWSMRIHYGYSVRSRHERKDPEMKNALRPFSALLLIIPSPSSQKVWGQASKRGGASALGPKAPKGLNAVSALLLLLGGHFRAFFLGQWATEEATAVISQCTGHFGPRSIFFFSMGVPRIPPA